MTQFVLEASKWINFAGILDYFREVKRSYRLSRDTQRTINELSKLSNRELTDIGLHRGDIWSVAHDIHYNNRPNSYKINSNNNLRGWV